MEIVVFVEIAVWVEMVVLVEMVEMVEMQEMQQMLAMLHWLRFASGSAQKTALKRAFPGPAGTMGNVNFYYANPPRDQRILRKIACGALEIGDPSTSGERAPAISPAPAAASFKQKR